jgi:transcriptional regulator with XRE-family HTH domain
VLKIHGKTPKKPYRFSWPSKEDDSAELETLLFQGDMTRAAACEFFGVTPNTLKNWTSGKTRPPPAVLRLARARLGGQLSEVMGKAWEEVRLSGDSIHLPGMKYPLTVPDLRAVWITIQESANARAACARALEELDRAKAAAAYYRDLIRREASSGELFRLFEKFSKRPRIAAFQEGKS